eukprot:3028465-Alexandrium_andersonii.AAC.1
MAPGTLAVSLPAALHVSGARPSRGRPALRHVCSTWRGDPSRRAFAREDVALRWRGQGAAAVRLLGVGAEALAWWA